MAKQPASPRKVVTLKDVAREAGVSIAAVSYSLNGGGTIGEEVRSRVRETAERLGYRPNRSAQAIRTGRSMTFGLVLPDLRNPYFPELAQSVERVARGMGYTVVLIDTRNSLGEEEEGLRHLEQRGVDGLVWCRTSMKQPIYSDFSAPMVVIGPADADCDSVTADDTKGGRLIGRHLLKMGHKSIGIISGVGISDERNDRRSGLLAEINGHAEVAWEVQTPRNTVDLEPQVVEHILRRDVTAISCGNDLIAIGVLRALRKAGRKVPEDVSVVGFDDIPWAEIVTPTLTTINQPVSEMAAAALTLLMDRLAEPDRPVRHFKVGVKLVERESVARLN
jgi:LacI family transcriptional regulator